MKRNITLSLDKELIKKGKSLASKNDISFNQFVSNLLKKFFKEEDTYIISKRKALSHLKKGFHFGGKITCSREELHER